jgi:hypothetical protein
VREVEIRKVIVEIEFDDCDDDDRYCATARRPRRLLNRRTCGKRTEGEVTRFSVNLT